MAFAAVLVWEGPEGLLQRCELVLAEGLRRWSWSGLSVPERAALSGAVALARTRGEQGGARAVLLTRGSRDGRGSARGAYVAAGDVRLDNRDEVCGALGLPRGPEPDDLALAAAMVDRDGATGADRLRGDFAFALLDPDSQQVLLVRDPFGVAPLYFVSRPGFVALSDAIEPLLALPGVSAEPEPLMLTQHLGARRAGYGHTFFRDVAAVQPRALTAAGRGLARPEVTTYYRTPELAPLGQRSRGEHLAAFEHAFVRAIRRRVAGVERVAVRVSGGLDSSSIAGVLATAVDPARCLGLAAVFPGWPCDEREHIDAVARALPFEVRRFDGTRPTTRDVDEPDPCWPEAHERLAGGAEELALAAAFGARVLLCGARGDALAQDLGAVDEFVQRGQWRLLAEVLLRSDPRVRERVLRRMGRTLVRRLSGASPHVLAERHFPAPAWVTQALRAHWPDPDALMRAQLAEPAPAGLLQAMIWRSLSPRRTTPQLEAAVRYARIAGLDLRFPMLDRDLVDEVLRMPTAERTPRGALRSLQREGLAAYLPPAIRVRASKARFERVRVARLTWALPALQRMLEEPWRTGRWVDPERLKAEVVRLSRAPESQRPFPACAQVYAAATAEAWLRAALRYHDAVSWRS